MKGVCHPFVAYTVCRHPPRLLHGVGLILDLADNQAYVSAPPLAKAETQRGGVDPFSTAYGTRGCLHEIPSAHADLVPGGFTWRYVNHL